MRYVRFSTFAVLVCLWNGINLTADDDKSGLADFVSLQTGRIPLPDGRIQVGEKVYESREAYYRSKEFQSGDHRCGTVAKAGLVAPRGVGSQVDCSYTSNTPSSIYSPDVARYRIPVVVHVITNSSGDGMLTPERVQAQIDVLNEQFLAIPGGGGAGQNTEIEFFLATEDPAGNPTNGITVTSNNAFFVDSGNYWQSLAWDTNRYMNVYTMNLDPQDLLGYVPGFPSEGTLVGDPKDRVVVHYGSFGPDGLDGPPYNLGRTLVHEVGHYLGLFHTFHEGCGNAHPHPGCRTTSDLICDTAPEDAAHYWSNCNQPPISCGVEAPISNYMSYANDACMIRFTPEQAMRMRCTLLNYRPNLFEVIFSTGILSVSPNISVTHSGLTGGPYSNFQTVYTAGNPGNSPVEYEVTIQNNFGLLLNGGTTGLTGILNAGQSRQIAVTLDNSVVNALTTGEFVATITFRDLTNGNQFVRTHRLVAGRLDLCFSGPPVAIPDNSQQGVASIVNVTQNGTIEDLDISVSINHTWVGDLVILLTHLESNRSQILVSGIDDPFPGFLTCGESNLNGIVLDDEGTGGDIGTKCISNLTSPPSYTPNNTLSAFDGLNIKGNWQLRVADVGVGDTGSILNWCLRASLSESVIDDDDTNPQIQDSDLDGLVDSDDNCPFISNADQADLNANGIGDACEPVTISNCPQNITLPATSTTGVTVDFDLPTAAGGFGNVTVIAVPASGTQFRIGTTVVTVTATDATGNMSACTFDVVVTDDPTIMNPRVDGEECGCNSGAGGLMTVPFTMLGIGALRRRRRRSNR